jgi:hypothetical protein
MKQMTARTPAMGAQIIPAHLLIRQFPGEQSVQILVCPLSAVHACPEDVPPRPTPKATEQSLWKGTTARLG